jgi:ribulose-5-phosphate 4-epimerase/fuculose-1-phosphate aldolase
VSWPSAIPDLGVDLDERQALACLLRILAPSWQENLSGHITVAAADGTMWCNPWGLWWQEVRASDIVRVDADGDVVEGNWDVTPAVFLHTELHRVRTDARIVVHNHPFYATLLACQGVLPVVAHQNSAIFADDLALVDEYDGTVESAAAGARLAALTGDATGILLANHGAVVLASSHGEAGYKATTLERMCRLQVEATQMGTALRPLPGAPYTDLKAELYRNTPEVFWRGAVRTLLREQPEVLS